MPEEFQKPANAPQAPKPNGPGPVVFSMPKEYRGGVDAVPHKPVPVAAPQPIPVAQPAPAPKQPPVPVAQKPGLPAQKSQLPYIVLALGVILIVAAFVVAYFVLKQSPKPASTPVISVPPTITPPPEPTPVVVPVVVPEPVPEPPKKPEAGIDSDSDGLSDVEELRLYGTLVFNPDTDADSFLDGNEIFHLYDPIKPNFTRLADSGLVRAYGSTTGKFSAFVPATFVAAESADGLKVTWSIPSGENLIVTARENSNRMETQAWFSANFPARASDIMMPYTTKGGLVGIQNADRLEAFLDGGNGMIYQVEYVLGPAKAIEYRQTYAMMLNSFVGQ